MGQFKKPSHLIVLRHNLPGQFSLYKNEYYLWCSLWSKDNKHNKPVPDWLGRITRLQNYRSTVKSLYSNTCRLPRLAMRPACSTHAGCVCLSSSQDERDQRSEFIKLGLPIADPLLSERSVDCSVPGLINPLTLLVVKFFLLLALC